MLSVTAAGSITGFLFQFEKALVLLATLDNTTDVVSIEQVDDVAIQNEEDLVLVTLQSKHSISPNSSTFQDTSKSLWRTIQIWIEKLNSGIFNNSTKFVCSTNKKIGSHTLLYKLKHLDFEQVLREVSQVLDKQKEKVKNLPEKESGQSIKQVIKLIEFALSNAEKLKIIKENLEIEDQESLKERFLVAAHLTTDNYSQSRKDDVYDAMYAIHAELFDNYNRLDLKNNYGLMVIPIFKV